MMVMAGVDWRLVGRCEIVCGGVPRQNATGKLPLMSLNSRELSLMYFLV
ncbi:MAG: hypothetical protein ACYS71_04900 [Planctomycetota bacterium]